jgi:hypothetical protein
MQTNRKENTTWLLNERPMLVIKNMSNVHDNSAKAGIPAIDQTPE